VRGIDYPNFKDSVREDDRHNAYWWAVCDRQRTSLVPWQPTAPIYPAKPTGGKKYKKRRRKSKNRPIDIGQAARVVGDQRVRWRRERPSWLHGSGIKMVVACEVYPGDRIDAIVTGPSRHGHGWAWKVYSSLNGIGGPTAGSWAPSLRAAVAAAEAAVGSNPPPSPPPSRSR